MPRPYTLESLEGQEVTEPRARPSAGECPSRRLGRGCAHELGISETTVRQHLSGLYRRTGCVNAAQAAYWLGTGQLVSTRAGGRSYPSGEDSGTGGGPSGVMWPLNLQQGLL